MIRRALVLALLVASSARTAGAQASGGFDFGSLDVPPDFLALSDLAVFTNADGSLVATGTTELRGQRALVLASATFGGGSRGFTLAVKPQDWKLTEALPALANPVLDNLTFSHVALVITNQERVVPSSALEPEEAGFYAEVYGSPSFTLTLKPGINLIAAIPAEGLPPDHPMVAVMDALGIEKGTVLLQGTLGQSLTLLSNPAAAGRDIIKDLYLRAELPPMRPPGSPAWFRSGQLALELTGDPSVRLVGEIGVTIDEEALDFFLAATLARTGVSLSGGLRAEGGWEAPFGIEWLVIHELIFKLGITSTGSIAPGFAGRMVIGEKDIAVAVEVAISPAGVPTNFIFEGESEAGFGLSDLVELQARMRAARDAAAAALGASPASTARLPLDALPDISFRDVELKFAPKPSPELGVERGFAVKGELWVAPPGGQARNLAGVDINVGEDGFWARGHLAAFTVGPLVWDDAELDLTLTPEDQHLLVKGQVQLFSLRQLVDLELSRERLRFRTETEIFDLFQLAISCEATFNLQRPAFRLHGVVQNDFGEVVQPIVKAGLTVLVGTAEGLVVAADASLTVLDGTLGVAQATAELLRETLERVRQGAYTTWQRASANAAASRAAALDALRRRDAAYRLWRNTPFRQASLKAQRRVEWTRLIGVHIRLAATYAAQAVTAEGARRLYLAIPAPDQNVVLLRAEDALARLRAQLEEARARLSELRDQLAQLRQAVNESGVAFAIQRAEVSADLEAMQRGEAVRWSIAGTFLDQPFQIERALNFSNVNDAVGSLVGGLLGW